MQIRLVIFSFLFTILVAVPAFSQIYHGQSVSHVSLVSGAINPGKGFTLGIHVQLEPGWHVYWKNPGDAGLAISAELVDQNGYTAGELKFPTPHKFVTSGEVLYGYDSDVVFLLPIRSPKDQNISPHFGVKINWLACKEVCLPGSAILVLNADSVSANDKKENQRILDRWTARLPQPGEGFNLNKAGVVINQKGENISVFIKFLEMTPGTVTDFFPDIIDGYVTDYSKVHVDENGISLTLTPESNTSKLTVIGGVAVIGTTGYEVRFPVNP
ncbi:MAG: protein-disulfide reductase DsbD domain-containing protein [bacterium]